METLPIPVHTERQSNKNIKIETHCDMTDMMFAKLLLRVCLLLFTKFTVFYCYMADVLFIFLKVLFRTIVVQQLSHRVDLRWAIMIN